MNKAQRKEIAAIRTAISDACDALEAIADQEAEKYDNLPDGLQDGEPGERLKEGEDAIREAAEGLSEVFSALEDWSE